MGSKKSFLIGLSILLLLSGCARFSGSLKEHMLEKADCKISVFDDRPDKRILAEDGSSLMVTPPIKEVLHSQLCQRDAIQQLIEDNIELKVYISDIKLSSNAHLITMEQRGYIEGYFQLKIPGQTKVDELYVRSPYTMKEGLKFRKEEIRRKLIGSMVERFANEIELRASKY